MHSELRAVGCGASESGQIVLDLSTTIPVGEKRCSEDQRSHVMPVISHDLATPNPESLSTINMSLPVRKEGFLSPSLSIHFFPRHWLVSTECLVCMAMDLDSLP